MSANRYIRVVESSSGLIKDSRIPIYSSKYSKKTYTQHQLLILLLLKEYLLKISIKESFRHGFFDIQTGKTAPITVKIQRYKRTTVCNVPCESLTHR